MADENGQRTLYVNRPLVNSDEIIAWAKEQGFSKTLAGDDLHVTIAFSRAPVDWDLAKPRESNVQVSGGARAIQALGKDGDAIVLRFDSDRLDERHQQFGDIGASWDWPEYKPHLTIAYLGQGETIDLSKITPFDGDLEFGPEEFAEVNEDWKAKATGAMDEMAMDWSGVVRLSPEQHEGVAFDRASVRRYDADQRLHVETANISKANVCPYLGKEIPNYQALGLDSDRVYKLLRDPDELAKGQATFNNLPILSEHVPVSAADHRPDLVIGSTGSHAAFDGPYLTNSLVFWAADAIGDIEANTKKELSSAYRYRADMTPGTHDGVRYDGIMRDIVGNHVALVKEGRAGSDVVVGDSSPTSHREISMAKSLLSRKAAMIQGALVASITPKLAQDAKIDFEKVLKGVDHKNFKAKKSGIADAFKGKLAQDADIDDVVELLDKLESIEPAEIVEEATQPVTVEAGETTAEDDDSAALEFLKGKLSDEDYQQVSALLSGTAMDDDLPKNATKDMVTKTAMDAAIKSAVSTATTTAIASTLKAQREIRDAERFVRPWAGDIVAQDSAEGVYRAALGVLGVNVDGVHADALKPILEAQPVPGAAPKPRVPLAQDAATVTEFQQAFPNAGRLK